MAASWDLRLVYFAFFEAGKGASRVASLGQAQVFAHYIKANTVAVIATESVHMTAGRLDGTRNFLSATLPCALEHGFAHQSGHSVILLCFNQ